MSREQLQYLVAALLMAAAALSNKAALAQGSPASMGLTPLAGFSFAPMLKKATPAVVNISVTSHVEIENPLLQDPFFRRFFNVPDMQQREELHAIGSGTIVDAGQGYILTNNHVVDRASAIEVRLNDDRVFPAKLIGRDPETDVAVLQIKADNLKALTLSDSDRLDVGDIVVAIGSPFGLRASVTAGIISGLGRNGMGGDIEDFIQTDASINPGNSGGALVNLQGELIGIPSQILSRSGGNIGIGFAIPINLAKSVMDQIIRYGSVQRGRIGFGGQDLDANLAKAFDLPNTRGAVVTQVQPGSAAERAGLESEDIILKANGNSISSYAQLRNILGLSRIGEKVQLDILRGGRPKALTLVIGKESERAGALDSTRLHPALEGATFEGADESSPDQRTSAGHGIVVRRVKPGSPASRLGLRPNDVILSVNRQPVNSFATFEQLASSDTDELLLHVQRGPASFFLLVP